MNDPVLYSFPFSCSLAVQIILRQHDIEFASERVERGPARKIGGDFGSLNAKRKVPTLIWEGDTHTEIIAILLYLDEQLVPQRRSSERRELIEWSSFIATELHQQVLGPLFDRDTPAIAREDAVGRLLPPVLAHIEDSLASLEEQRGLLSSQPSGADAYLFWALTLIGHHDSALVGPGAARFNRFMKSHEFVRAALAADAKALEAAYSS